MATAYQPVFDSHIMIKTEGYSVISIDFQTLHSLVHSPVGSLKELLITLTKACAYLSLFHPVTLN